MKSVRKLVIFVLLLSAALAPALGAAHELKVVSVTAEQNGMDPAAVPRDLNGNKCVPIVVMLNNPGVSFSGNIAGEPEFKTNEYWVYVSPGAKELEISYPDFKPTKVKFKDLGVSETTAKTTYGLRLSFPVDLITDETELSAEEMYDIGVGYMERRDNQYIRWMTKAADMGHPNAMYYLGSCYLYGNGVPKDKEKGLAMLEQSAEKGLMESSELLGLYYNTLGKDKKKAKMWYEKAEQQRKASGAAN